MSEQPTFHEFGDEAVRFCWSEEINDKKNDIILSWAEAIRQQFKQNVEDITIGYHELSVHFPTIEVAQKFIRDYRDGNIVIKPTQIVQEGSRLFIPVCYEEAFGWDTKALCEEKKIDVKKLIDLHTAPAYRVYFLGFLPGFPYLGGMNKELSHSRLSKPRREVPAGAVGIAGNQTGIYPTSSPGGWNLIGQTPIRLFDPQDSNPTLLKSGDKLSFYSISPGQFESMKEELALKNMIELRSFCQEKRVFSDD